MSGVEALGLLLGIVPLLISAIEHYDDVLRPIHRYREFTSKSQRFCDELETERIIFQAEIQLLLGEVVGPATAQQMLRSSEHPLWRDGSLCRNFESRLGSLGTTCLSVFFRIRVILKDINSIFQSFIREIPHPSDKASRAAYKERVLSVKKKLKFAFSEDTLRSSMKELRSQNEIFRVISGQIVRLNGQQLQSRQTRNSLSESKRSTLRKLQLIRTASCRLYEALNGACSAHKDHLVKFCLEARFDESGIEFGCCRICFQLAYAPISGVQITATPQISSTFQGKQKERTPESITIEQSEMSLPPALKSSAEAKWLEVESVMGSWTNSVSTQPGSENTSIFSIREATDECKERRCAKDLCIRLQPRVGETNAPAAKSLVIVLDDADSCKQCIYYPSKQNTFCQGQRSTSLTELLSMSKTHPIGSFPHLYRLRIARSLVTAVLQFYATPWLTDSWQSRTLFFNSVDPMTWGSYVPSPHLLVQVAAASEQLSRPTTTSQATESPAATVPNLMLFNLGIMLIELAYSAPFLTLLQSSSVTALADSQSAELSAAYQLASNVGVFFGSGYADIVRKCLRCDFGEGEELSNPALQERLYEDVVCRLERMEDGIRKLQGEL